MVDKVVSVTAMFAPSLSDHLALVAADPALAGHSVVIGLVVAVESELVSLRAGGGGARRPYQPLAGAVRPCPAQTPIPQRPDPHAGVLPRGHGQRPGMSSWG